MSGPHITPISLFMTDNYEFVVYRTCYAQNYLNSDRGNFNPFSFKFSLDDKGLLLLILVVGREAKEGQEEKEKKNLNSRL